MEPGVCRVPNYLANNRNCSRGYKGDPNGRIRAKCAIDLAHARLVRDGIARYNQFQQVNFQRRFVAERLSNRRIRQNTRSSALSASGRLTLAAKF